jgi:hypothetical protein
MDDLSTIERPTEEQRIEHWRLTVLSAAGYPSALAQQLAESGVDLRLAERLVLDGCPPDLAARILL